MIPASDALNLPRPVRAALQASASSICGCERSSRRPVSSNRRPWRPRRLRRLHRCCGRDHGPRSCRPGHSLGARSGARCDFTAASDDQQAVRTREHAMSAKKTTKRTDEAQDVEGPGYLLDPVLARQMTHDRRRTWSGRRPSSTAERKHDRTDRADPPPCRDSLRSSRRWMPIPSGPLTRDLRWRRGASAHRVQGHRDRIGSEQQWVTSGTADTKRPSQERPCARRSGAARGPR